MIDDSIQLTWQNLKARKLRSWLTVIGIVIGVAAIVSLISLSQGMQNAIESQFASIGIKNIQVVPGNLRGPPTGDIGLNQDVVRAIERSKYVDYINPLFVQFANVNYKNEDNFVMINGYDPEISKQSFIDSDIKVEQGRLLNKNDKFSVILGNDVAKDTFNKEIRLNTNVEIEETNFRVVGIFELTGTDIDNRVIMNINTAREIFNKPDQINGVTIKILDGIDLEVAAKDIQKELERDFNEDEFEVFTPEQLLSQFNTLLGIIQLILISIASISLVVGGIGILNSMYTSVLERTREIGIMKAIGATNKEILQLFLIESASIGLVGGVIGIILGSLIALAVGQIAKQAGVGLLLIKIDPTIIIVAILFSVIAGTISGTLPAVKASKLKPVEALRYE